MISPPLIAPPILLPASPRIIKTPPDIWAPASLPTPSKTVIRPLFCPWPTLEPASRSQVMVFPSFPAPRKDPQFP